MKATKCDYCPYSVMKKGHLNCRFDKCGASAGRILAMAEMAEKANLRLEQARIAGKSSYRQDGGWISVDDRLPTKMGYYLVCIKKDNECVVTTTHFTPYGKKSWIECNVTHWMPLPKLPESEGKDNG